VVGYDDSMLARLAHVDLTTVSQDAGQQAAQAVDLAVERLEGGRTAPREVVLTRAWSCAAPPRPLGQPSGSPSAPQV
jgi:DNA-binding LacI/PurR family transcriptional regulator